MNFIKKTQLKNLALIAIISFSYLAVNAQPGVLEMIFRSGNNNTQIINSSNYGGEIVLMQIVDETENSIVYEAKALINASSKTRLNIQLPKGAYKVIFTNLKQQPNTEIHKLKLN